MRNVTIWSDDSNAARAIFRKQRTGEVSVDYAVHLGRPRWKGKPDDRAARRAETAERKPRHRDRAVDRGRTQRARNSGRPCAPCGAEPRRPQPAGRSEEHRSRLQSLMRHSIAAFFVIEKYN